MHHSARAFLADVDTSSRAAGFRGRQRAQIASLAAVPLQSWRYDIDSPVTDQAAIGASAKRLGAPVLIVHVSLSYALKFVDPRPTSRDLWWTFVRRPGRVVIAADDDLARTGGASWTGPWDYGRLLAVRGRASLVLGHPSDSGSLPRIAAAADAAVPAVTDVWGPDWTRRVAVLVPGSQREVSALLGASGATLTDISAVAVSDAGEPNGAPPSGQRLVLNPAALHRLSPIGLGIVVRHEVTHIASAASTGPSSPRWLVEGFADYVGNRGSGQSVRAAAPELRADVARGQLPAALPADAAFAAGGAGLPQVYEQSWLACRLVAAKAGPAGLVRLYRLVGASTDSPRAAVAAALQATLRESPAAFTAQWRSYLRGQLG
jgi:hypothetical protein